MIPTDWLLAAAGGALIGLAATLNLLFSGRVTGVSGIYFGALNPQKGDMLWRYNFLAGLIVGGIVGGLLFESPFANVSGRSMATILVAGFLVGFGTTLGSGCTSGHGVCGISRMSPRSIVATGSFMAAGILTVAIFHAFFGGQ